MFSSILPNRPFPLLVRMSTVVVVGILLAGCSGSGGSEAAPTSTAAPGRRDPAPLGGVELPPLEFNEVDNSGTVSADITSEALFDKDSAELKPATQEIIDQIGTRLATQPASVRVDGFTDGVGSEEHNLDLSQRRAEALAAKISELGTAKEVQACGRGEQGTDGQTEDPAARRVVVTISVNPLPPKCQ